MNKIFLLLILFLFSCTKTVVVYDEEKKGFIIKQSKTTENSISLEKGDECQVVDNIFVVCGQ